MIIENEYKLVLTFYFSKYLFKDLGTFFTNPLQDIQNTNPSKNVLYNSQYISVVDKGCINQLTRVI